MPSNQTESVVIPWSKGVCASYCGRIYYASRQRSDSPYPAGTFDSYDLSTGCDSYETIDSASGWDSVCTPSAFESTPGYYDWIYSPCFTGGHDSDCPLGWGDCANSWLHEGPFCFRGSYYPNPIPEHVVPSDVIGSTALSSMEFTHGN